MCPLPCRAYAQSARPPARQCPQMSGDEERLVPHDDQRREDQQQSARARHDLRLGALVLARWHMFHPVVQGHHHVAHAASLTGACGLLLIFAPLVIVGNEALLSA